MKTNTMMRIPVLALLLAPLAAPAQMAVLPLPLSGPAYALAQDAYQASARGDYQRAMAQLREAIRLRPDVAALRQQLQQTRQASTRTQQIATTRRDAGYDDANAALRAYDRRDYPAAAQLARTALDKTPDNRDYWLLLSNALIAQQQYEQADQALQAGIARLGEADALTARRADVRREMAALQAARVFSAQQNNDAATELEAAQQALTYAPANPSYRLMQVLALLHNERWRDAVDAASAAYALDQTRSDALVLRAYAYQRLGQSELAAADFAAARTLSSPKDLRSIETIATAAQSQRIDARHFPVPALDCSDASACRVVPGQLPRDRGYAAATLAYQALAEQHADAAVAHAQNAVSLSPDNPDYGLLLLNALLAAGRWQEAEQAASSALANNPDAALLAQRGLIREHLDRRADARSDFLQALAQGGLPPATEIDLLLRTDQQAQARRRFVAAQRAGSFAAMSDLELAYLAARTGENQTATLAFARADARGALPDSALEDAAYSATHAGHDADASAWFKRSIDAANAGRLAKTEQQQFATRRALSTTDREFGVIASLTRSGGGPSAGTGSSAGAQPGAARQGGSLQAGSEVYWRPFGYRDGSTVEVFGRVFQTLQDRSGGSTGTQTAQATVGARWKPWPSQNVVASFGRLLPLGSQAGSDWLAQLAYSDGVGTDLRVDRASWWTTQWYAEAGRYVQHPQTYGLASVQAGRSLRLDAIDPRLVVFPHLSLNTDYNSLNQQRSATGLGPGVNLRYWFRADAYHAPRSYLELSLQYRLKIGGDERARGFFMSTTLSY